MPESIRRLGWTRPLRLSKETVHLTHLVGRSRIPITIFVEQTKKPRPSKAQYSQAWHKSHNTHVRLPLLTCEPRLESQSIDGGLFYRVELHRRQRHPSAITESRLAFGKSILFFIASRR